MAGMFAIVSDPVTFEVIDFTVKQIPLENEDLFIVLALFSLG